MLPGACPYASTSITPNRLGTVIQRPSPLQRLQASHFDSQISHFDLKLRQREEVWEASMRGIPAPWQRERQRDAWPYAGLSMAQRLAEVLL
jgi:hypothetical protein